GKPYTARRLFMKGLCKRAGVKQFGFHLLRRFVASVLADTHKVSLKKIQFILGHGSLRTTEKYVYNIDSDMKATMNLLSEIKIHEDHTRNKKGVNLKSG
ncbi:MAG: tyrosine-type recombinase/integrase, partial [Deltaproteobacteria bacterium]|nr:tyrosine-type recombinase/integrase [Deltaproteobacteria bacterium]